MGVGFLLFIVTVLPSQSYAGVNVSVGINIPAFTFAAPPSLVVIPGTYAYFAPDAGVDIVFYGGYWYRPYEDHWYRARGYNGPWAYIAPSRVPGVLINLPPDYRHAYAGHPRMAYRDVNKNWRRWEKDRYWDRNERWREGAHHARHHEERRHEERREDRDHHDERGRRY